MQKYELVKDCNENVCTLISKIFKLKPLNCKLSYDLTLETFKVSKFLGNSLWFQIVKSKALTYIAISMMTMIMIAWDLQIQTRKKSVQYKPQYEIHDVYKHCTF